MLTAFLDTCVLFPLILRDILLDAAQARFFAPRWSDEVLIELRRNLIAHRGLSDDQATRLIAAMRRHFPTAAVASYEHLIPAVTTHPKDRHVVAAAAKARATVIVTSNLRDFPSDALTPFGLVAQSPDHFLTLLFDVDAERMGDLLHRLAASYRAPAMSLETFLARLETHAPTLVHRFVDEKR